MPRREEKNAHRINREITVPEIEKIVDLTQRTVMRYISKLKGDKYIKRIGGRKDGIHARQPFNAFPENQNNTDIYVVDVVNNQLWSASVNSLPVGLKEQLQSTNMNFYQDNDTLYIIGGYAFSASANDHITHNKLTAIDVVGLINAIENGTSINSFFKQISSPNFAITGGQLGKIGNEFYLVGGHEFTGRYNPMNGPSFTQTYSSAIRKFEIDNYWKRTTYFWAFQITSFTAYLAVLNSSFYNSTPSKNPEIRLE